MKRFLSPTLAVLAVVLLSQVSLPAQSPNLPEAAPPYFRVHYEASNNPGELVYAVSYTVWLPPGIKTLRGLIVHQHGCGEGACKAGETAAFDLHWQTLAQRHGCALLGPSYEQPEKANCGLWCDPRNGSEKRFLQSLQDLATQSRHPELATAPWALWGHSGGANWAGTMLLLHPDKIAAVWLRSGSPKLAEFVGASASPIIPPAALGVPVLCNLGVREQQGRFAKLWEGTQAFFGEMRSQGGLIALAIDPNSEHDCGNSRYLAVLWLDACLTARLPVKPGDPLLPMPRDTAWLAASPADTATPEAKFSGDKNKSLWLPNEHVARAWAEYNKDGNVSDSTPPPAPQNLKLNGNELTWSAVADFESGLAGFVIERDGVELARLPEKPAAGTGRKVFQKTGYSDTPTPPLASLRFTDTTAQPGQKHSYRIYTINSVGGKSEASTATH